ncbi:AIR synthase family protein [Christensenellaceae bacterium OttesenSCG-928-M15]|nr:AIR synthase family protein [Christensenellaceae bacterium OttesenSCG-928-M15]
MRLGKLSNEQLERLVLSKYRKTRDEALNVPSVGDDCAVLDVDGDLVVLSTDPITSATGHIGRLSVHINCNDAAAAGAEPIGLLVTLLAPPDATETDIEEIAAELSETAQGIGVDVLGGHTEVTDSVTRFVTNTTVVARLKKEDRMRGMRAGDDIICTKWAGLEGSILIATDFQKRLPMLSDVQLQEVHKWVKYLSVVPEGRYAAQHGASAMHDITEGGVYGAAWEMSYVAGVGIELDIDAIEVHAITKTICDALKLDAMRLLSSGCMLIACENGKEMVKGLQALGIAASVIGKASGNAGLRLKNGEQLAPPEADELYKLF